MSSPGDHLSGGQFSGDRLSVDQLPGEALSANRLSAEGIQADRRPANEKTPWAVGTGVTGSVQSLLGTVVIAVFVITFVVQAFQIPSPSMENTLLIGDYLLVNKLCYGGGSVGDYLMPYRRVQRGDIVVFHYPVNPAQHFVKRVIGVPGDRVRLINKQVFVNGVSLKEPYAHFSRPANDLFRDSFPRLDVAAGETPEWWVQLRKLVDDGQLIVPQGHYFVMGDNRDAGQHYWAAAADLLVGARGRRRAYGAEFRGGQTGALYLCDDPYFPDHALEPHPAVGELNFLRIR
jgi:signal peptidase I